MTMTAVSGEVLGQIQSLLHGLSSSDNKERDNQEKVFESVWVPQPSLLVPALCVVLSQQDQPANVRSLSAILLRRIVGKMGAPVAGAKAVRVWNQLDAAVQAQCREILLRAWAECEESSDVRNKISDCIAELARIINVHEEWSELLSVLWTTNGSKPAKMAISALRILSAAPECVSNQKGDHVSLYLGQFFVHPDPNVRISCMRALYAIITCWSDDRKVAFVPLVNQIPEYLKSLAELGSSGEESLSESMQVIVDIVEECPKMFRSVVPRLVPVLMLICTAGDAFEAETRSVALELLTTLIEVTPATFKKQKDLLNSIVMLLLKSISDNLDDGQEWYAANPDDENDEEELSLTAEQALDRVAIALGGKVLLGPLMSTIPEMLRSSEWQHRYAALRAIADMAEGCADMLADNLENLLSLVWPAFSDPHPRVQYAACHALGQLCTDFAGPLQEMFASQCLSSLLSVLVNSNHARVQCHAAAALINFAEDVDSAIIAPVLDGLLNRLVALLNSDTRYLQEQVLATMAAFSSAAGPSFAKFIPQVMPLLMGCLTSNLDRSFRQLQCRALDAATRAALAVGKAAFGSHMQPLIELMVQWQQSELEDDDMVLDYLPSAWVRICQVLGEEFAPCIPLILPRLLEEASAEPDLAVIDAAEPEAEEEYDSNEWAFATVKGRRLGIHTATLDLKCAAVENLSVYIATLQLSFAPFIEATFRTILPLVNFNMHDGVQCAAADALASLVKVCFQASSSAAGLDSNIVKELTARSLQEIVNAVTEGKPIAEVTVALLDSMADIINVFSASNASMLPDGMANKAFGVINGILSVLHQHRLGGSSSASDDEEDEEDEEIKDEEDEDVMYALSRLSASLFKCYGASSLPLAESLLQFCLQSITAKNKTAANQLSLFKHASICILDDLVHWLGAATAPIQSFVVDCFSSALRDPDPDNRQAAIFGIGMCSEHAPAIYQTLCLESLPHLLFIINHQNAKAPSHVTVTDNAMSAVARICKGYPGSIELSTVLPQWLNGLPVTHDQEETPTVYSWLLELLSSGQLSSLMNDQQVALTILHALAEVIIREALPSDSPLKAQIISALSSLQHQLGAPASQMLSTSFTPDQLSKLQSKE